MATYTENLNPSASTTSEHNPSEALNPSAAKPDPVVVAAPTVHGDSNDSKATATAAPVSDTEKKIRRAERFGINLHLSEQEKRDSRAQRFGTGSAAKSSEALKRKARAERFGLPATADDEEKKKARLLRFAPTPKSEEKNKGSDIRPSQPSSSSLSINGKGNIGPKAAIAGKAGGRS